MTGRVRVIVFGAMECRKVAALNSRSLFKYWRDPARGADRFPEPDCRVNGKTEVWDPGVVMQWIEQTRERRGMVWTNDGLVKIGAQEPGEAG